MRREELKSLAALKWRDLGFDCTEVFVFLNILEFIFFLFIFVDRMFFFLDCAGHDPRFTANIEARQCILSDFLS